MKQFTTTYTQKTSAKRATIWQLWSEVNRWPEWDVGLASCHLSGAFLAGNSLQLRPKGAPSEVTVTLQEVVQNEHFTDRTDLGFATIEALHKLKTDGDDLLVTHTVVATVASEKMVFFEKNVWPGFEAGLPKSVANLVALAAQQEKMAAAQ